MEMTEVYSQTQLSGPAQTNRWAFWGIGAGVLGISGTHEGRHRQEGMGF